MHFDAPDLSAHDTDFIFAVGPMDRVRRHLSRVRPPANFTPLEWRTEAGRAFGAVIQHGARAGLRFFDDQRAGWSVLVQGTLFDSADGELDSAVERLFSFGRTEDPAVLRGVAGLFVAVLFSGRGRLYVVTDCLGVRPFFACERDGLVFGTSHALLLGDHAPGGRRAHLGAVSQYLLLGYNASSSSLLEGISRLPPSSATRWCDGVRTTFSYARAGRRKSGIGASAMAERVHGIVSRSYANWTRPAGPLVTGLSGGYDSRYLAALATVHRPSDHRFVNVANEPAEAANARTVASRLGVDLEVIRVAGSTWDLYEPEDVFHGRPDGFPVTKSFGRLLAREAPGARVVNGYLGDALIRGHLDHLQDDSNPGIDPLQSILHQMSAAVLQRCVPRYHGAIRDLASEEARRAMRVGPDAREPITFIDLYLRQRCYIDNNFVQNLHETEPVLPFLDPELIDLKREHPLSDFGRETYDEVFRRAFPDLVGLGHNKDAPDVGENRNGGRVHRRWARQILWGILRAGRPSIIDRAYVMPRVAVATVRPGQDYLVRFVISLAMLEWFCVARDIHIDWSELR